MKENDQIISKNDMKISLKEIIAYIEDVAAARGWSMDQLPQIQFNFICQAVGLNFFNSDTAFIYINNNKNMGFNYNTIENLFDYYFSICNLYNKIPSIISFTYFCNIDYWLLYNNINSSYNNYTEGASLKHLQLLQKLNQIRENSLKDRAIDKGGAVGVAIVGNTEFAWNDPNKQIQATNNNNTINLPAFENTPQKALKGI